MTATTPKSQPMLAIFMALFLVGANFMAGYFEGRHTEARKNKVVTVQMVVDVDIGGGQVAAMLYGMNAAGETNWAFWMPAVLSIQTNSPAAGRSSYL